MDNSEYGFPVYIYKIKCLQSRRVYIGKTMNYERRIRSHFYALRRGKHPVALMQSDFDKYGELCFASEIIGKAPSISIQGAALEKEMMAKYKSYLPQYGYNYKDPYFHPHGGKRRAIEKEPNDFMEVN